MILISFLKTYAKNTGKKNTWSSNYSNFLLLLGTESEVI